MNGPLDVLDKLRGSLLSHLDLPEHDPAKLLTLTQATGEYLRLEAEYRTLFPGKEPAKEPAKGGK